MEHPVLMGASRRFAAMALAAACAAVGARAHAFAQSAAPAVPASAQTAQPSGTPPTDSSATPPGSTSTQTIHEKTGPNSSRTIRHTRVVEQGSQPPELTQAADAIQKRDYTAAEALLRKGVDHD